MEMRVRDRRTEGSRSHEHVEEEEEDANDQVEVVVSRPLATITTTMEEFCVLSS